MTTIVRNGTRAAAETASPERRRHGRPDSVSPQLLSLLRAEERAKLAELVEPAFADDRRLDAGQGLALGLVIGALMWAAMIATGFAILGG